MRDDLALLVYGLILIGSYFTSFFWGRTAIRRIVSLPKSWRFIGDQYSMITSSLCLGSVGIGVIFTMRAWRFLFFGESTVHQPVWSSDMILMGLWILVISFAGRVWAINMHHRAWVWRVYLACCILWGIIAAVWVWVDPFHNYPYR